MTMASSQQRRVGALVGHLSAAGASAARGLTPLTDAELADFTRKGFCMFTIPNNELPAAHHAQYYADLHAHSHGGGGGGDVSEPMPVEAVADVVNTPSFAGALRSILGPAYLVNCYGNGTPILHAPRADGEDGRSSHRDNPPPHPPHHPLRSVGVFT